MQPAATHSSWKAQLSLEFEKRADRTVVASRKHAGPLVIQKPFYPEGAPCHIYLLHPPGGLVGGDQLILNVKLDNQSHVLITTPSAAKFYRSAGPVAQQNQTFNVCNESLLEWMPQETIVFDQSNAAINTEINLEENSKVIGWEIICLGRTASGEKFVTGNLLQKLQLSINNKPTFIERALFQGKSELLCAPWGLANQPTVGTMIVAPGNRQLVQEIREKVHAEPHELFSVTLMDKVLVCRYLGPQAEAAKDLFIKVWKIVRPHIKNIEACIPRIWNT
jgi:urease accessory protein